MVILADAMVPKYDSVKVAQTLGIPYDTYRFFTELHPKLAPVETVTSGIFLAGACSGPKDIPDTVAQAGAAAAKVCALFSKDNIEIEPTIAQVNFSLCSGCETCKLVCPFNAIEMRERNQKRRKAFNSKCYRISMQRMWNLCWILLLQSHRFKRFQR